MEPQRLVVRLHDPRRLRLVIGTGIVLALLFCAGLFELGQRTGGYSSFAAARERAVMESEIARLDAENKGLKEEIAQLQTTLEVDRQAQLLLKEGLTGNESLVAELNEELAFYRRIMAPADGEAGLRIQAFEITGGSEADSYRLKLVLVQSPQRGGKAQGQVDLRLKGVLDGRDRDLSLQELSAAPLQFEFLYFQELDLEVTLPEGFKPATAFIELRPVRRNASAVAASFPWKPRG